LDPRRHAAATLIRPARSFAVEVCLCASATS
jgi:hypothetical protein